MRRCLKGLGGFPSSNDGFILGPPHGTVGRLDFFGVTFSVRALLPANAGASTLPTHSHPGNNPKKDRAPSLTSVLSSCYTRTDTPYSAEEFPGRVLLGFASRHSSPVFPHPASGKVWRHPSERYLDTGGLINVTRSQLLPQHPLFIFAVRINRPRSRSGLRHRSPSRHRL